MNLHPLPIAATLTLCALFVPAASGQEAPSHPRTITVSGSAEVKVAPDEAILTLGVETHDRDINLARAQNAERVKKALALAQNAGVSPADIQTCALSISSNYSDEKVPRLLGYDVTQTVVLTLKDTAKYESLLTSFLEAGVNRVDRVEFAVAEPRKYQDEARSRAIRAAREKATAMAAELGQTIGTPLSVEEVDVENYFTRGNDRYMYKLAASSGSESSLASGQAVIRASVRISFQLE